MEGLPVVIPHIYVELEEYGFSLEYDYEGEKNRRLS